ncbi:dynactin subunit 6, putative [Plasmodium sp. gorilla clade G2]|uniref:dynactin subunit 6, putative n=1 Tax=Plasmodium sp. gorilla clade G2 TaxID=880535 RepID=UPI000D22CADA|nr:dynactin subunit 6, putative [Plasmodium sp. gorilla clade G2]SOV13695.1 dynactin subunit 6, putative [Plasmodium sp. gorilla clade G2]
MNKGTIVKLHSLNLDRNINKNVSINRNGINNYESDLSISSYKTFKNSSDNTDIPLYRTCTNDSDNSIKNKDIYGYKKVVSLNEYIFKFKKLTNEKNENTLDKCNIFRRFNTNQKNLIDISDSCSESNLSSECNVTIDVTRNIMEKKKIQQNISDNMKDIFCLYDKEKHFNYNKYDTIKDIKKYKSHMPMEDKPLSCYLNSSFKLMSHDLNCDEKYNRTKTFFQNINSVTCQKRGFITCSSGNILNRDIIKNNEEKKSLKKKVKKHCKHKKSFLQSVKKKRIKKYKTLLYNLINNENKLFVRKLRLSVRDIYSYNLRHGKNKNKRVLFFSNCKNHIYHSLRTKDRNYIFNNKNKTCIMKYNIRNVFINNYEKDFNKKIDNNIFLEIEQKNIEKDIYEKNKKSNDEYIKNELDKKESISFYYDLHKNKNIIIGNRNIIFPSCQIKSDKAKIIIGENNLFEDLVTIINNTSTDMYIGSYNIFRSGSYIYNTMNIGDRNCFDYKCNIIKSNIGSHTFIGINMLIDKKSKLRNHHKIVDNVVIYLNSQIIQDNMREIISRYNHIK